MMDLQGIEAEFGSFELRMDATLAAGVTGVFGVSGAGKTTLLELIAGVKRPRRGRLVVGGEVFVDCGRRRFAPSRERNIGYVPQDLALFPHMTVEQNIRYGADRHGRPSRSTFEQICEVLEIENKLLQYPGSLSGGEEQRVAFARALMTQPSYLLLDEPLRGLHDELRAKILMFLVQIRDQFDLPMLYVTHSPAEVMTLCQEVLILNRGTVIGQGMPCDYFVEETAPAYHLKPGLGV